MAMLITYKDNYADEFDIDGFMVCPNDSTWEEIKGGVNFTGSVNHYFGTNEFVHFASVRDYFACIIEKHISDEELDILSKLFNFDKRFIHTTANFICPSSNY